MVAWVCEPPMKERYMLEFKVGAKAGARRLLGNMYVSIVVS